MTRSRFTPTHKFLLPLFAWAIVPFSHGAVVTYIDLFNAPPTQVIATNNATVTNTVATATAIGGFRTLELSTSGGNPFFGPTILGVDGTAGDFLLSTPAGALSTFVLKWGGTNGTAGLGGVDLTGGFPSFTLDTTLLTFDLTYSDQPNNFTWTFTDTSANVATYTGSFPTLISPPNPAIPYAISLASFTGGGIVDWTSINFITLSGGGLTSLDMTLASPIAVVAGVPEPGTWAAAALLLVTAVYIRWRRARGGAATAEEAPAAA